MMNTSDSELIDLFEKVHGKMTGRFEAQVVYDENMNPVGVACLKDGSEAWRATLVELLVDIYTGNTHRTNAQEAL